MHKNRESIISSLCVTTLIAAAIFGIPNYSWAKAPTGKAVRNPALKTTDVESPAAWGMAPTKDTAGISPKAASALNMAGACFRNKRTDDALKWMDVAISLAPKSGRLQYEKGELLGSAKRYDAALKAYSAATKLFPGEMMYQLGCAKALMELSRFDEALAAANRAAQSQPSAIQPVITKALILAKAHRDAEAIAVMTKVLDKQPRHSVLLSIRASCYLEQGNLAAADKDLLMAKSVDPSAFMPYLLLSLSQLTRNEVTQAMASCDEGLVHSKTAIGLHLHKGICEMLLGKYDAAAADLKREIGLIDWNDSLGFWAAGLAAICYRKLGQTDMANQMLQAALGHKSNPAGSAYIPALEAMATNVAPKEALSLGNDIESVQNNTLLVLWFATDNAETAAHFVKAVQEKTKMKGDTVYYQHAPAYRLTQPR